MEEESVREVIVRRELPRQVKRGKIELVIQEDSVWVAGEKVTVINNDPFLAQLTTECGKVRTSLFNVIHKYQNILLQSGKTI